MEEIYKKIKIVPLNRVIVHEGIVEKWAERIAEHIEKSGVQRNPIVVSKHIKSYIVLDGMHRVRAMQLLGCRDIMVYITDYYADSIKLMGWDALVFGRFNAYEYLKKVFSEKKFEINRYKKFEGLHNKILARELIIGVREKHGYIYTVGTKRKDKPLDLDLIISATESYEFLIDAHKIKTLYVPNSTSWTDFMHSNAVAMIVRPQFTKDEVIYRTIHHKLFPRKSTRHIIPERPLGVDLNFILLKEPISLKVKNRLLKAHLDWCWKSNRVRFYPESVYMFSD